MRPAYSRSILMRRETAALVGGTGLPLQHHQAILSARAFGGGLAQQALEVLNGDSRARA